jgi:hypothetical protein
MVKNMIIGDSMRLASRDNNDLLELKEVSDEKRSKWIATRTAPARQRVLGGDKGLASGIRYNDEALSSPSPRPSHS